MGVRAWFEKRDVFTDSPAALWDKDFSTLGGLRTFAGKRINRRNALAYVAVYQCTTLICDGIATLPVDHFRKTADGRREHVPSAQSPAWISKPNPFQTAVTFWTRVLMSLLTDGNAFIATIRDDLGRVKFLYCLDPSQVVIIPGKMGDDKYEVAGEEFDRSQVLHIPAYLVGNDVRAMSPIDVAREAIALGLTAEEFGARFFSQGVTMSGIIEHPNVPNKDEARLLREMFRKTHGGTKNSHAVGILTGGASFKPITVTPEQAQFLESRKFQKTEIAGLYRVPAYLVDPSVTSTWGSGIEEQNKMLVDMTFGPWAIRIEQAISTFLLAGPQFIKFNFDARLRGKTKERYDSYAVAVNNGWMCIDEVRALEDLPPLPNGQGKHFWRPAAEIPIKQAIDQAANNTVTPQAAPAPNDVKVNADA